MTSTLEFAIVAVLAYIIGGIPVGYWFVRLATGQDIRTMGSGNIGATNVHRTMGRKAGLTVLLLDVFKGFLAVFITGLLTRDQPLALALSAGAVILGHCFPVFLRFRGGKGVACFIGAFLYIAPLALAAVTVVFLTVLALSRYISLGSLVGAVLFPFAAWLIYRPSIPVLAVSVFAAALIVYRHRANISRIRSGTEHVFSLKGRTV